MCVRRPMERGSARVAHAKRDRSWTAGSSHFQCAEVRTSLLSAMQASLLPQCSFPFVWWIKRNPVLGSMLYKGLVRHVDNRLSDTDIFHPCRTSHGGFKFLVVHPALLLWKANLSRSRDRPCTWPACVETKARLLFWSHLSKFTVRRPSSDRHHLPRSLCWASNDAAYVYGMTGDFTVEYLDWQSSCDSTKACRSRWQDLKISSPDIQSSMDPVQFSSAESFQILSIQVHIRTTSRCWKRGWTRSASRMCNRIRTERLNRVASASQSLSCSRVSRMICLWCQTRPLQWTWVQSLQKLCDNCGVETPAPQGNVGVSRKVIC